MFFTYSIKIIEFGLKNGELNGNLGF